MVALGGMEPGYPSSPYAKDCTNPHIRMSHVMHSYLYTKQCKKITHKNESLIHSFLYTKD